MDRMEPGIDFRVGFLRRGILDGFYAPIASRGGIQLTLGVLGVFLGDIEPAATPLLKTPLSQAQAQAQAYSAASYTAAARAYGAAAAAAQPTVAGYTTVAGYGRAEYPDPYLGHGIGPVPGYAVSISLIQREPQLYGHSFLLRHTLNSEEIDKITLYMVCV
uniref:Uncharacterized protein n=1 Tax=Anopheles culicifacies TaxID=139723 RepID=A0A182M3S9_9DIPT